MVVPQWVDINIFTDFLIAIALGALIGMEREMDQQHTGIKEFAGVRTFILISLFGALVAYISQVFESRALFISIALFGFMLFIIASYVIGLYLHKKIGATTQMSALLAFVLGVMCLLDMIGLAVIITILITIFLALKQILHGFAKQINMQEVYATLEFALISLVILPFLPNKYYGPLDAFNPYNIWLMVVFIAAISYIGYILMKWKGEKGLGWTGFLGGLISSTSVAVSMANQSRKTNIGRPFVSAVIVASTTMFFRVLFIGSVINKDMILPLSIPIGAMAIIGLYAVSQLRKAKAVKAPKLELKSPFTIVPALKFAVFYALVLFVVKAAELYYGNAGVYAAALLAGIADLNAITISMATLSFTGAVSVKTAVMAIVLAISSNNINKMVIGHLFGNKEFGRKSLIIYACILIIGLIAAVLI
jgi:uncharacterized membrane protein (DUF4010 family)